MNSSPLSQQIGGSNRLEKGAGQPALPRPVGGIRIEDQYTNVTSSEPAVMRY